MEIHLSARATKGRWRPSVRKQGGEFGEGMARRRRAARAARESGLLAKGAALSPCVAQRPLEPPKWLSAVYWKAVVGRSAPRARAARG